MPLKDNFVYKAIPARYENTHEPDIDEEIEGFSKCWTVLFWVVVIGVLLGSTLRYALIREREIIQLPEDTTVAGVSYEEYLAVQNENPICPCSRPANPFSPYVNGASLAQAAKDTIDGIVQITLNSNYVLSQMTTQEVIESDILGKLDTLRHTSSQALRGAFDVVLLWASFNLPGMGFYGYNASDGLGGSQAVQGFSFAANTSADALGAMNGGFPLVSKGPFDTLWWTGPGLCLSYFGSDCDRMDVTLNFPLEGQSRNDLITFWAKTLCVDPTNSSGLGHMAMTEPPVPPNFTEWCWVAEVQSLEDQSNYDSELQLKTWMQSFDTLTVYNLTLEVDYKTVFTQCAPVTCTYATIHYPTVGQIASFAVSLYGGVSSIAGSIFATVWAARLAQRNRKRKLRAKQDKQMEELRKTSSQLVSETADTAKTESGTGEKPQEQA